MCPNQFNPLKLDIEKDATPTCSDLPVDSRWLCLWWPTHLPPHPPSSLFWTTSILQDLQRPGLPSSLPAADFADSWRMDEKNKQGPWYFYFFWMKWKQIEESNEGLCFYVENEFSLRVFHLGQPLRVFYLGCSLRSILNGQSDVRMTAPKVQLSLLGDKSFNPCLIVSTLFNIWSYFKDIFMNWQKFMKIDNDLLQNSCILVNGLPLVRLIKRCARQLLAQFIHIGSAVLLSPLGIVNSGDRRFGGLNRFGIRLAVSVPGGVKRLNLGLGYDSL